MNLLVVARHVALALGYDPPAGVDFPSVPCLSDATPDGHVAVADADGRLAFVSADGHRLVSRLPSFSADAWRRGLDLLRAAADGPGDRPPAPMTPYHAAADTRPDARWRDARRAAAGHTTTYGTLELPRAEAEASGLRVPPGVDRVRVPVLERHDAGRALADAHAALSAAVGAPLSALPGELPPLREAGARTMDEMRAALETAHQPQYEERRRFLRERRERVLGRRRELRDLTATAREYAAGAIGYSEALRRLHGYNRHGGDQLAALDLLTLFGDALHEVERLSSRLSLRAAEEARPARVLDLSRPRGIRLSDDEERP